MVKVSAPGSIFFLGEHSVVYGRPVLIAAIGLRTYSEITKRGDDKIFISSAGYGDFTETIEFFKSKEWVVDGKIARNDYIANGKIDKLAPLKDLIGRVTEIHGLTSGFELRINSDIPQESGGMSSSTAALCSVLSCLNDAYGLGIPIDTFFDALLPFQSKIHGGTASGSELISSSHGGHNWVKKDPNKSQIEKKNLGKCDLDIIIGDTCVPRFTKETVDYVRAGHAIDPESYNSAFDSIGKLVASGEQAIKRGDLKLLGELMDENHEILARDLGVSHPKLNKLVDTARKAGAYGAKLSGGGKGGVMIALVDKDRQDKVAKAIQAAGGKPYITTIGGEGLKIDA